MREKISLAGLWDYSVPGGPWKKRKVPGSYLCVGDSLYRTAFAAPPCESKRVLLCFEGIAYEGIPILNGAQLGEMEPYSVYTFDITDRLLEQNELIVRLKDCNAVFGPSNGWQNYSGIIRQVYLTVLPETYIDSVFFYSRLSGNFTSADCTTEIRLGGKLPDAPVPAAVRAERNGLLAATADGMVGDGEAKLRWTVENPALWSPERPDLYDLTVTVKEDTCQLKIGFKEFRAIGNKFYLNGKPYFLAGVCRHDLWGEEEGHTLTDEQIEQDMRRIRDTGLNYVRLVHYPHDSRVLEAADRLGLLVSCEPGFWWSQLEREELVERGREVMARVVRRDRNHVSVAFWLTFNECVLTADFLQKMVLTVRENDPTRMVSGANCMDKESTKRLFSQCGFDFYTYHPYGYDPGMVSGGVSEDRAWKTGWQTLRGLCECLNDKPLLFTEWGGHYVHNNGELFASFCREMLSLADNESPEPVLAGASYWAWADYYEFNRPKPSSLNGITFEGLNDCNRHPRVNLEILHRQLSQWRSPKTEEAPLVETEGFGTPDGCYLPIELPDIAGDEVQQAAWYSERKKFLDYRIEYADRQRVIDHGPQLPRDILQLGQLPAALRKGRPYLISTETGEVSFPVGLEGKSLYVIGNACFNYACPIGGERGRRAAEYVLSYDDGSEEHIPLRDGYELVTVHCLYSATRIEPTGASLSKAATFTYDPSWERYQISLLKIPLKAGKRLVTFKTRVFEEGYTVLFYGMTAER